MRISKPKFWQKRFNIYSILLIPFTIIFLFVTKLKKYFIKEKQFNIPIICVGNIYIGGTGKTPLAIEIAREISNKFKPVIIKKFYKSHKDEQLLIKKKFKNLILNSRDLMQSRKRRRENSIL